MRRALALVALGLLLGCGDVSREVAPETKTCLRSLEIKPGYTPVELYGSMAKCASEQRMLEAVDLFAHAFAFASFDARRVRDARAPALLGALPLTHTAALPEADREALYAALEEMGKPGSEASTRVCTDLRRLGPPTYVPEYLSDQGIDVQEASDGFDARKAWDEVLAGPLRCG